MLMASDAGLDAHCMAYATGKLADIVATRKLGTPVEIEIECQAAKAQKRGTFFQ